MKTIKQYSLTQTNFLKTVPLERVKLILSELSIKYNIPEKDIQSSLKKLINSDVFEKENNNISVLNSIDKYGTSKLSELIAEEKQDQVKELASKVFKLKTKKISYSDILIQIFDKIKHTENIDPMVVDTLYAETENQLSLTGQNLDQLHDIHNV